jgi:4,5-dihydroxyphthalate decarboxylase
MIASGDLDALMCACAPLTYRDGTNRVRRLFQDFRAVERDYYQRTGIFPIMHLVVIRREIYDAHPWVAQNLYKAFCDAKAEFMRTFDADSAMSVMLPWTTADVEEARDLMGADFWPYGLEPNRHVLETLVGYAHEQGLIDRRFELDSLFAPETLETYRI